MLDFADRARKRTAEAKKIFLGEDGGLTNNQIYYSRILAKTEHNLNSQLNVRTNYRELLY